MCISDACTKSLVDRYSPFQVLFVRSIIALPPTILLAFWFGAPLRSQAIKVHALRGAVSVVAAYTFFQSLALLPLVEATTLFFTAPLFVALLSVLFLKEQLNLPRAIALAIGFIGVMIVLRPGMSAFQPSALLSLLSAFLYAIIMLTARRLPKNETIWTMMIWMTVFPLLFTSFVVFLEWPVLLFTDLLLLACMGFLATVGLALISQAFRMAPATLVAPFDYTALLWASFFGWIIFSEMPDLWVYAGAAAIIGGSIYLLLIEGRKAGSNS